jgi:RNA polymerase sigma-B factor
MTVLDSAAAVPVNAAFEELPDAELFRLYRDSPESGRRREAACEVLVRRYTYLVQACVRPFRNSPESADDLMQVGFVGLLKAIRGFDPAFGNELRAYAVPCITGELKRHFRDRRWQVRVPRVMQELLLEMRTATEDLTHELGRPPEDEELAGRLGVTPSDLHEARQAAEGLTALSLNAPVGDSTESAEFGELLGAPDTSIDQVTDMAAVERHWDELPEREQQILLLRFYGNHSQEEVADRLGISQMHVSRLQARALTFLRERINGAPLQNMGPEHLPDLLKHSAPGSAVQCSRTYFRRPGRRRTGGERWT